MDHVIFNGSNWDEYEMDFFSIALKRGSVGLDFIRMRCLKKWNKSESAKEYAESNVITKKSEENISDRQNLMSDMLRSITAGVYKRLKHGSRKEILIKVICEVDHKKLWDLLYTISMEWDKDSSKSDADIKYKRSKYGPVHGVVDMLKGTYVVESWKLNTDPTDLTQDIVLMTSNLALGDDALLIVHTNDHRYYFF